ncbi:MAG TPA: PIG-L deacetylase family protein [Thermoanaerobaculia bacterium]|jgi:LmbE family N-acetylglucosaminyl deacetylase|nr:PIG-L deacetylase family protein [Thermoanaerobaculia bacterium]
MDLNRTLVIAPHPDDESIAAGGLLQRAIAAGGEVRVIVVTDGDNNPWPMRYLKKKVWINDADRAEWGALRREESRRALATLGVPPTASTFLGYPDRLLTTMARRGDLRVRAAIAAVIEAFAPSLLVIPSAFDLHPDHRAIGWFAHDVAKSTTIATYVIHGHPPHDRLAFRIELNAEEAMRKLEAIECHQSQLVLSRTRFLSYARPVEEFFHPELDIARLDSRMRDWSCAMKHAARVVTRRGCT